MNDKEYCEVAEFCKTHWKSEVENVLKIADLAVENKFLFNMPWDMERTETVVSFSDKIDWNMILNGDVEFLFQFNRHRFLIVLGQAYRLSGDEKYVRAFVRLLGDWISRVKRDNGANTPWRSLEVGIRGEVWTQAMRLVESSPLVTEELKKAYRESLKEHSDVLVKKHSAFQKASNWGVIQDCGLFAIATELGNEENRALALKRLEEQAELQFMGDGTHWEQSPTYHNEVLFRYFNVFRLAKETGLEIPKRMKSIIDLAATVNLKWITPDGCQPLLGDSDRNRLGDFLAQAALILERSDLKFKATDVLDYESAWLFGTKGIQRFAEMRVITPDFTDALLEDGGTYVLRSDFGEKANYLAMHNGYTGAGHAHADKLHFELSLGGEDVFVDAGRYTYIINKTRKYFKGASAHNTTTVGNRSFLNMRGWGYWDSAQSIQYPCFKNEFCTLIGGAHLGYKHLIGGVFTERQILLIKPDIYLIIDGFKTCGFHRYRQYFHFNPDGTIDMNGNVATYLGLNANAKVYFLTDGAKVERVRSEYSPHYNLKRENAAIKTKFFGFGDRYGLTVICGGSNETIEKFTVRHVKATSLQMNLKLPTRYAEGVVIKTPTAEYTVAIAHKELKAAFECNGKIATGKLTVFRGDEKIFVKW